MKAILGEKLGMTQIFDEESSAIPVTVIKAGPVKVTQIKRSDKDGYDAIVVGAGPAGAVCAARLSGSGRRTRRAG